MREESREASQRSSSLIEMGIVEEEATKTRETENGTSYIHRVDVPKMPRSYAKKFLVEMSQRTERMSHS